MTSELRNIPHAQAMAAMEARSGNKTVSAGTHKYYSTFDHLDQGVGGCGHTHGTIARANKCAGDALAERNEFRMVVGFNTRAGLKAFPVGTKIAQDLQAATDTSAATGEAPAWLDHQVRIGKYRGCSWRDVADTKKGRGYLRWAIREALTRTNVNYRSLGEFAKPVLAWWLANGGDESSVAPDGLEVGSEPTQTQTSPPVGSDGGAGVPTPATISAAIDKQFRESANKPNGKVTNNAFRLKGADGTRLSKADLEKLAKKAADGSRAAKAADARLREFFGMPAKGKMKVTKPATSEAADKAASAALEGLDSETAAKLGDAVAEAAKPKVEEIARKAGAEAGAEAGTKTGAVAASICVEDFMEQTMPNMVKLMVEELAPRKLVVETPSNPEGVTFESQHPLFEDLLMLVGAAQERRVWIAGPAGSGKTTAVEKVAIALGMEFFLQTPVCDKFELFGYNDVNGNYVPTPVHAWANSPDGGVLLLDEIDAFMPQALVAANTFLADRGWAAFPDGTKVRLTEKHVVIVTANTWGNGPDSQYVGRAPIDAATKNRFPTKIDWGYDEMFESRLAASLGGLMVHVKLCQTIRRNLDNAKIRCIFSPRDTFSYCAKRNAGFTHDKALDYSVLAELPRDQRAKALNGISRGTPGVKAEPKPKATTGQGAPSATDTQTVEVV